MRSNTVCVTLAGQAELFDAEKFDLDAVIVGPQFALNLLFDVILNLVEL